MSVQWVPFRNSNLMNHPQACRAVLYTKELRSQEAKCFQHSFWIDGSLRGTSPLGNSISATPFITLCGSMDIKLVTSELEDEYINHCAIGSAILHNFPSTPYPLNTVLLTWLGSPMSGSL
ncbi:unnamed protein product [Hymenolepis diminuta]|uniref:Uncharacterized protein n=1 Tax=Hymenolepis diminuta TaxID=6216 RepID=A0A564Y7V6_HYMDI|nr:unnamed protein product [Hymenolepis diminuta]